MYLPSFLDEPRFDVRQNVIIFECLLDTLPRQPLLILEV